MKSLSCGLVGLPNVGKSTLFNALTKQSVAAQNYPFCTIEPNVGIVPVPDARLQILSDLSKSHTIIPATVTFVDIAGLVKGASQGEGLGNKFLSHIREVHAILQVVRCFESEEVIHVSNQVDPLADCDTIELELLLADLQMAENAAQKLEKRAKSDLSARDQLAFLQKAINHLGAQRPMRALALTEAERPFLSIYIFLTNKPILYLANLSESDLKDPSSNTHFQRLTSYAATRQAAVVPISAKLEEELGTLSEEEARLFLEDLGLTEPSLPRLVRAAFSLLNLCTYFTTGEQETRAWTILKNTLAPQAAGEIHSDLERGFIRAEVIAYDDFVRTGGRKQARDQGVARSEGKEYVVKDGDVILFFNN